MNDEEPKIGKYYQNEAKHIVDMLFETEVFHEKITRDSLQTLQDLLAYYFVSYAKTASKMAAFN